MTIKITVPALVFFLSCASNQLPAQKRLTIDKIVNQENIQAGEFSPDGHWYSFVVDGPKDKGINYDGIFLWDGHCNSAVYVYDTERKILKPLVGHNPVRSATWQPSWSPNGRWLAYFKMYATVNESTHPQLWVWDTQTNSHQQVSQRLDFSFTTKYFWTKNNALVYPEVNRDTLSLAKFYYTNVDLAQKGWAVQREGKMPSVNILESSEKGIAGKDLPKGINLVKKDLFTDKESTLTTYNTGSEFSPGNKYGIGYTIDTIPPLPDDKLLHLFIHSRNRMQVFDENGNLSCPELEKIHHVIYGSISWSPDETKFVFEAYPSIDSFVYSNGEPDNEQDAEFGRFYKKRQQALPAIYEFDCLNKTLHRLNTSGINPAFNDKKWYNFPMYSFQWTTEGSLLLEGKSANKKDTAQKDSWWQLSASRKPESFTRQEDEWRLDKLYYIDGNAKALTLHDGVLYEYNTSEKKYSAIGVPAGEPITSLGPLDNGKYVVLTKQDKGANTYLFDYPKRSFTNISATGNTGKLNDPSINWQSKQIAYMESDSMSRRLYIGSFSKQDTVLSKPNLLDRCQLGKAKKVKYFSLKGDTLTGWVLLPWNYISGKKYPLITWVYQGTTYSDREPGWPVERADITNAHLFSAQGYAVFFPSMPGPSASMDAMLNGIVPGVDKVIAMGIADPTKLIVAGHSGGGFTTYGIIAQTNKFKSAIALAGMSDYFTEYLSFEFRSKYKDPLGSLFKVAYSETGGHALGNLPWRDPQAYIHNSPLFRADSIRTPVLIIQGDRDYVSMLNGEEMFTALYRLGRKVRFARYWGEDHIVGNPANTKDAWEQMFKWLKETGCGAD